VRATLSQSLPEKSHRDTACVVVFIFPAAAIFFGLYLWVLGGSPCSFKSLTGIPCLSCGMTRSATSLVSGDLLLAFKLNPLFLPLLLGLLGFWVYNLLWLLGLITSKWNLYDSQSWVSRCLWSVTMRLLFLLIVFANWVYLLLAGR